MAMIHVVANRAKVRSVKGIENVLDSWYCSVDLRVEKEGKQRGGIIEISGDDWPAAFTSASRRIPPYLRNAIESGERIPGRMDSELLTREFGKMLAELGPFLKTPLTVQAVAYVEGNQRKMQLAAGLPALFPILAVEWHVKPGIRGVEINTFKHSFEDTEESS
jgi:hypothetical protein